MSHSIVVPCYNEADRLEFQRFSAFLNANITYNICFVNDGSSDATLEQLLAFKQQHNNQVFVVNLPQNRGKAEAVRQGIQHMMDMDIVSVGYLDADLATDFPDYMRLVDHLENENLNMVFGSRKMGSDNLIKRKFLRAIASSMIGVLTQSIIGMPIKDTQCGAKVFTKMTARNLFSTSFHSRWLFDVELFIRIKNLFGKETNQHIKEVALTKWEDVDGSKITFSDSMKFPMELLEIGLMYKVRPHLQTRLTTRTNRPVPSKGVSVGAYNNAA